MSVKEIGFGFLSGLSDKFALYELPRKLDASSCLIVLDYCFSTTIPCGLSSDSYDSTFVAEEAEGPLA